MTGNDERPKEETDVREPTTSNLDEMPQSTPSDSSEGTLSTFARNISGGLGEEALNKAGSRMLGAGSWMLGAAVIVSLVVLYLDRENPPVNTEEVLVHYGLPLGLLAAAAIFSAFGFFILRSIGLAGRQVLPKDDHDLLVDLIKSGNNRGIDSYVKLSGLSGTTGFFQKIGVSGLPLATIFLSLVFAMLTLLGSQLGLDATTSAAFGDLAKLTLGAFLGSYVQRQQGSDDTPIKSNPTTEDHSTSPKNSGRDGQQSQPTDMNDLAPSDALALIKELAQLRESGVLASEEYETKKAVLLKRIN